MRILHIHPAMKGGGIEAMICGLANEMSKTEDVTVCSIFKPSDEDVFWGKLSPRVHRISLGKTKIGFNISILLRIWKLINKEKYDVVNMHGFFYYYVFSVLTQRRKTHFFYTIHSDAYMENGSWGRYVFGIKKHCFRKGIVKPITISKASNNSFHNLYGIDGRIIENGIPLQIISNKPNMVDKMRITDSTKVFLHPGRITKAKNQVVLCQVFRKLVEKGYDVVLIIAGSKQEDDIYERMEPYFNDRIKYVGERTDVVELLSRCDGMCLPSIWEGLPVTLLEALSVGCIPICSPVGGIVDVINNGINGLLSISSKCDDYYNTMVTFLEMKEKEVSTMKEKARESFKAYDIKETAKRYLEYYTE